MNKVIALKNSNQIKRVQDAFDYFYEEAKREYPNKGCAWFNMYAQALIDAGEEI